MKTKLLIVQLLFLFAMVFGTNLKAQTYCEPSFSSGVEPITSVVFGDIDNQTQLSGGDAYEDFTSMSTSIVQTAQYTIEVEGNTNGNYTSKIAVYIDWDQDGEFDGLDESFTLTDIVNSTGNDGKISTGTITVPSHALLGTTRMRVMKRFSSVPTPCNTAGYGQAEDYTVTVLPLSDCTEAVAGTISSSATEICATDPFTLTATGFTGLGNGLTYQWQSSPAGQNAWADITGANDVTYVNSNVLTEDTDFQFVVSCSFGSLEDISNIVSITLKPFADCYCEPITSYDCSYGATINGVSTSGGAANISNTSTGCSGGYIDYFTTHGATVAEGTSFDITVDVSNYGGYVKVWIDYNQNGVFDASELVAASTASISSGSSFTETVLVPLGTMNGETRMRVRLVEGNSTFTACSTQSYGETEDYKFEVAPAPSCLPPNTLEVSNITSSSAELGWTENNGATTWNIEYGPAGFGLGNGTLENGVTSNPFTLTGLSSNTDYEFYVQTDCGGGDESFWVGPFAFTTPCEPYSIPYFEGFEAGYTHNTAVGGCLTQESIAGSGVWTANNTLTTYNRTPRTGDWNAFLGYSNTDWIYIPIQLDGGTSYTTELYARQDATSGVDIEIAYGLDETDAAMTDVIVGSTAITSGNYQLVKGTFTPTNSGVYYIGIKATTTFTPYYVSIDDISIYETPSCLAPSDLMVSNLTATSADLGWTENNVALDWNVEYGEAGFGQGNGTTISTTTNPHELTGLTAETDYEFYVQSDCGNGDESAWAGPFAFTTLCGTTNLPYTQDFESATAPNIPTCTSIENTGIGNDWKTKSTTTTGFTGKVLNYSYHPSTPAGAANSWFYTQGINLVAGVSYTISYKYGNNSTFYTESMKVAYGNSPSESAMTNTLADYPSIELSEPVDEEIIFTVANDDVYYFGFNAYSIENQNQLYLDDIEIYETPTCFPPSDLMVSNLTATSADLGWTENNGVSTWNIEFGAPGFVQGNGTTVNGVTSNPYTLTGLTADTDYEFYVQSDCGNGDESAWAGPFSFYTGYCIPSSTGTATYIDNFTTSNGSTNISNLGSGFTADGYLDATAQVVTSYETASFDFNAEIVGGTAGFAIWIDWNNDMVFDNATEKVFNTTSYGSGPFTGTITVPAGTPQGDYRMRITTDYNMSDPNLPCGDRSRAEFEDYTLTLVAPPSCLAPGDLVASATSSTTVDLSWTEYSGATTWNVEYGATGFGQGNGTTVNGVTSNPYTLTGLTADTDYEFYVQSDCGNGDESAWAGPFSFYTGYCTPVYTSTIDYTSQISSDGAETDITYSASAQPTDGYADETAQVFESYETQTFDINTTYVGGANGIYIWVDWNNDLVFDEVTELVASEANSNASKTLSITVPTGTAPGNYRMRIRSEYGSTAVVDPCESTSYGSAVDFTLTIVAPPSCLPPSDLMASNITSTSADLGWTSLSGATTWNVEYGPAGFGLGNGTVENGVTSNPHTITISPETEYEFYVQSDCGNNDESTWAGPFAFSNSYCVPEGTNLSRYIDDFSTTDGVQNITNNGSGFSTDGYGDFTTETVSQVQGQTIDFSTAVVGGTAGFRVWIDWDNDFQFDASDVVYQSSGYLSTHTGTITVPAGTTPGPKRMRIVSHWLSDSGDADPCETGFTYGEFEDYTFEVIAAPCLDPTDLTASNITAIAADLGWTESGIATTWNIEYGETGYTQGNGTTVNGVTSNPYTLTGLDPSTTYEFYVQADCGGDESDWAGPFEFTTLAPPPCDDPSGLTASNETPTSVDLTWTENGTASEWNIEYGETGYTQGNGTSVNGVTTNPYTLTGLTPGTAYDAYVQSDCGGSESNWVGPVTFTTVPCTPTTGDTTATACDSFEWYGTTYTSSGTPTHVLMNAAGCDSTVTLTLTINYSTTGTDTQEACDSYTWIDGVEYTASNNSATYTLTNAAGCDSIVTLNLTINNSTTGVDTQEACDSYTWIDGVEYTASNNTATHTLTNAAGCDSIVTLDLTILESTTGVDTQTACGSFTWIDGVEYTSSNNTATHTIPNAVGCDSLVTLNLTIDPELSAGDDNAVTVCREELVDLDTLLSSGADANGAWLNPMGTPLASSVIHASSTPGDYVYTYRVTSGVCPVEIAEITITVDGGCTSDIKGEMMADLSVYPNPATTVLNIVNPSNTTSLKVEMIDMNGRVVLIENKALNNATEATLAIDHLVKGVYTLRVYNDEGQRTFKIVKH